MSACPWSMHHIREVLGHVDSHHRTTNFISVSTTMLRNPPRTALLKSGRHGLSLLPSGFKFQIRFAEISSSGQPCPKLSLRFHLHRFRYFHDGARVLDMRKEQGRVS